MSTDSTGLAAYPTETFEMTTKTGDAADAYNKAVTTYNTAVQTCAYLAGVYTDTASKLASVTDSTKAQLDALNSIFSAVLNGSTVTIVGTDGNKEYKPSGSMSSPVNQPGYTEQRSYRCGHGLNALYKGVTLN